MIDFESYEAELDRKLSVRSKRENTPCSYKDGLSYDVFEEIAISASKKVKRIKSVHINNGKIFVM